MPTKYRIAVKRSPPADPQQYRVYRLENEAIGARHYARLTRSTIRRLVRSVCRAYRLPQPDVVWKDLGKWAAQWESHEGVRRRTISFNTHKQTSSDLLTVTHELAHHLHYELGGEIADTQESHGPQFMACHMSILDTCRVIPVIGMRAICDRYKIRYIDPGDNNSIAQLQRAILRTP